MSRKSSNCPHVTTVGVNTWEDIFRKKARQEECMSCGVKGPNLWMCMHSRCLYVGCGESAVDHSSEHSETSKHYLTVNLTTMRIWCYVCESEVYRDSNSPPLIMQEKGIGSPNSSGQSSPRRAAPDTPTPTATPEPSDTEEEDENHKPRGLTGLQNIGNTCYMNAALQALSNCPPLTRFFLDCQSFVRSEKKPMLSRSYMKLITDIWHKRRPGYVVPSSVAHGIKIVHPMFRGYTQQDTQEFLRCFMDQLHEELKQPIPEVGDSEEASEEVKEDNFNPKSEVTTKEYSTEISGPETNSQSDEDYETCDSGMSSERSSVEHNMASDEVDSSSELVSKAGTDPKADKQQKRDKNKVNIDDINLDTSSKEYKDSMNKKKINNTESSPSSPEDFTDAMAELEPLQGPRKRTTSSRSQQSDCERPPITTSAASSPPRTNTSPTSAPGNTKKKPIQYTSVISDIFDGKILSSVQCLTCERVSSTRETFQDLSLPIPTKDHLHMIHASHTSAAHKSGTCGEVTLNQGWISWMFGWMKSWFWGPTITLQDCLAAFFSADELKGDNMYSCEKCKKLRNGVKYSKVIKLPEILCVHLKRFRHEFMFSTKINSYVSFPMENLDMGMYLHKECKDSQSQYDLVAVICHHGTAGGGHYTAYALNYLNDQWYEFDDQYVTEVDITTVENCEAYVLFYRKKNDAIIPMRQKAEQLIESAETSIMKFYISKQWVNRFNTFAEPGPITNNDFLCKHGGVPPSLWGAAGQMVEEVAQETWEFLLENHGGGPVVNHLYQCTTCQNEMDKLRKRQTYEMETFIQLNSEFQNEDSPGTIYAISMAWFKDWENFVRTRTDDPPGSIDNSKIAMQKGGSQAVRPSSDYGQLSEEMWRFLYDIYGGGPELILKQNATTLANMAAPTEVKVNEAGEPGSTVKAQQDVKDK